VAIAAVVLAVAFGLYRQYADGRFRRPAASVPPVVEQRGALATSVSKPAEPTADLWSLVQAALPDARRGERATLLQFSSAFCAPCRATRRTLADVADALSGVVHVEVDAEHHLELVRALGILRTPTTIVLDGAGREVARAAGAPRKEQVLAALP
jgi:thiol-disulfide isomerase/thioredoxin